MNKIKILIISVVLSLFSISIGSTNEFIGVIAAGIGDI